ncbi:hypothetical protein M0R04_06545 [Candidatus Dojkabacteria bacterium]|jgi:hypothetical protein|nr:hypothetical protein [Candidatus Dojkabacteria bacterium]
MNTTAFQQPNDQSTSSLDDIHVEIPFKLDETWKGTTYDRLNEILVDFVRQLEELNNSVSVSDCTVTVYKMRKELQSIIAEIEFSIEEGYVIPSTDNEELITCDRKTIL